MLHPPFVALLTRLPRTSAQVRRQLAGLATRLRLDAVWVKLRRAPVVVEIQRAWRRSLQVRVISITLVISGSLVLAFGLVVGNMINTGLVNAKTQDAVSQAMAGSEIAKDSLGLASNARDPILGDTVKSLVAELATRVQASDADVALVPGPDMATSRGESASSSTAWERVPLALREAVRRDGFVTERVRLDLDKGSQLYLVIGRQVRPAWDGSFELYYFFPLSTVQDQVRLVGNTIAITGLSLLAMLAVLAALVTRMVVRPVRLAARTAQRLSNGLLDQRMEVTGEDELAALAASFNQMAENLQRHILRLEELSRLQRRFTSDVSHELRTPLTTVRMAADLIFNERAEFSPPVARSAELLQAELNRFEHLLAELLEISRFDAGFASLDPEPADVCSMVTRAAERLSALAARAHVGIEVDLPTDPIVAEVDVRRIERVLRNLIGNAIEHGEGRPVRVRLRAGDGAVAITVRDYGVGLKPGEEKLVFNRFWRADPSRARTTGGTGLGLSISAEDARLHGGWLDAWGAPGRGAQFRLTLPLRAGDTLTSSPIRLTPPDAQGGPMDLVAIDRGRHDEMATEAFARSEVTRTELVHPESTQPVSAAEVRNQ